MLSTKLGAFAVGIMFVGAIAMHTGCSDSAKMDADTEKGKNEAKAEGLSEAAQNADASAVSGQTEQNSANASEGGDAASSELDSREASAAKEGAQQPVCEVDAVKPAGWGQTGSKADMNGNAHCEYFVATAVKRYVFCAIEDGELVDCEGYDNPSKGASFPSLTDATKQRFQGQLAQANSANHAQCQNLSRQINAAATQDLKVGCFQVIASK